MTEDTVERRLRVLIAEDSAVSRVLLAAIVGGDPGFEVVAMAKTGREAVEMTERLRPDVVLMDAHMPEMSGAEATRRILQAAPTPVVMISASIAQGEAELSFEALEAGALTLLAKPVGPDDPAFDAASDAIRSTLRLMAEVPIVRRRQREAPVRLPDPARRPSDGGVDVVAIAASTGGPRTLVDVLGGGSGGPPVLLVQHMAEGFVSGFAGWLAGATGRAVIVATDGAPVVAGRVYVAPDGGNMVVGRQRRIRLEPPAPADVLFPRADPLLASVAAVYGERSAGVVLTGMGGDGAEGLLAIRRAGGRTIAQDEASCIVFGMPRRAVEIGAAEHVMAPEQIRSYLAALPVPSSGASP